MVLPLTLLKSAVNQPMFVELKNGETYSGVLVACDFFMNLHMRHIVCTSKDGDRFWNIPECYVRGNNIKHLRLPEEVLDLAMDEQTAAAAMRGRGRGRGRGGRGRGGEGRYRGK